MNLHIQLTKSHDLEPTMVTKLSKIFNGVRFKACLVAKGFHQRFGIYYIDTFSPVVKPTTIHVVLSLVVSRSWSLRQLDVNNVFLQGNLSENVYMSQPPGFVDQDHPTHICRLRKAIYGLKQAPRAWYQELHTFLLSSGFKNSYVDASLFVFNVDGHILYFLVYVDDIIITSNNPTMVDPFVTALLKGDKDTFSSTSAYVVYLVIYCDHIEANQLCSNPVFHSRMKHVAIDFHFIRDQVQNNALRVAHISLADQITNALTKPLPRQRFLHLKFKIGLLSRAPS
ncbi:Retrovirus-related Pol polyprotein from transposon RE1 [Vitis vinifera]|uniref:Retrovirus-related Pol polyprotein from transposon RE1 n=1 Tax=Vitis vinifera TaxID=29760 RepID=A0A438ERB3_VITVI|nr:Retrovirus-related Pol polyprotein from transposon RE1 [Vitis vinifera]